MNQTSRTKRIIIISIVSIVGLLIVAIPSYFAFKSFSPQHSTSKQPVHPGNDHLSAAQELQQRSQKKMQSGDKAGALRDLKKAREMYKDKHDTEAVKNINFEMSLAENTKVPKDSDKSSSNVATRTTPGQCQQSSSTPCVPQADH